MKSPDRLLAEGGGETGARIYADELNQWRDAEASLARARSARAAALAEFHKARVEYHRLTAAAKVARFVRLANQRAKLALALQETGAAYGKALDDFMAICRKIDVAFSAAGCRRHGGHLLFAQDLNRLVPFVSTLVPDAPDQFQFVGLHGTLTEKVATANAAIIADVSAGPKETAP